MADENITIIAPTSEVADGLDLYAVSELFKETANLEDFEAELNNPDYGINNLDLDGDGYIDFIRVVEEIIGDTHVIILQALVWEDEIQDVATIEIETSGNNYDMHVHGNEVIYGANYYIAPSHVHINTWPIITWISRSVYRPYHSTYYWKSYPTWWKSHRPIVKKSYQLRVNKYKKHNSFVVTRNARVKKVTRIKYKPRTSVRVSNHVRYKKPNRTVNRTSTIRNRNHTNVTRTNTKKVAVKQPKRSNNHTTVRKKVTSTNNYKNKGKTTVNKNKGKTTVKKTKTVIKTKDKKVKKKSDQEK